jgi:hypothetical protein
MTARRVREKRRGLYQHRDECAKSSFEFFYREWMTNKLTAHKKSQAPTDAGARLRVNVKY